MANNSKVVQEFLAQLSFKVDQKTLDAFSKALKTNATEAVAFGKTWSDMAEKAGKGIGGLVKHVFELTNQLDQLYFASRRMQETASNITAMGYVYKQMGMDPARAQATGESLQEKRMLMGKQGFARWANSVAPGAGVTPDDSPDVAQKKMMHTLSVMAHGTEQQQRYAVVRAQMMGVSVQDLLQWDPNKDQQFWDQSKQSQKEMGANLDQNAKAANATATEIRQLTDAMDMLQKGMIGGFLPTMQEGAREGNILAGAFSGVARGIEDISTKANAAFLKGVPPSLIPGFLAAKGGAQAGAAGGHAIVSGLSGIGAGIGAAISGFKPPSLPGLPSLPAPATAPAPQGVSSPDAPPSPGGSRGGKGIHWDVAQDVYKMLTGLGIPPEVARGAVGVLGSESMGFNLSARPWSKKEHRYLSSAEGLAQWVKARRDAYEKATGKKFILGDEASQLDMLKWELMNPGKAGLKNVLAALRSASTLEQGGDIWERLFEGLIPGHLTKGRDDYAIDKAAFHKFLLASGGGAPMIQNNYYNIRSTDPKQAANEVQRTHQRHTARSQRRALA